MMKGAFDDNDIFVYFLYLYFLFCIFVFLSMTLDLFHHLVGQRTILDQDC